jgi:hypothetical protein
METINIPFLKLLALAYFYFYKTMARVTYFYAGYNSTTVALRKCFWYEFVNSKFK